MQYFGLFKNGFHSDQVELRLSKIVLQDTILGDTELASPGTQVLPLFHQVPGAFRLISGMLLDTINQNRRNRKQLKK